jgi:STE24 endopeptidase
MTTASDDVAEASPSVEVPAPEMTSTERDEARRYGRISVACTIADMAIDTFYLGLMALVFARPIDAWLASHESLAGPHSYWRLLALLGVVFGVHVLVSLPLSFYSGYVVEHQFKLSNQSPRRWTRNWLVNNAVGIVLSAVLMGGLFWIIWNTGSYWWLIAAGAFFVVTIVLGQLAPVVFLPLFYKIKPIDDANLLERMKRLADGTGLTIEGVYRLGLSSDTKKANAMLAGLGRTRRVLMGDTLLDEFTPEEIDVIFAHEIGHHVHRHLPKMIATGVLFSLAGFWICDRAIVAWAGVTDASAAPTAALPLVMFTLAVFQLVLGPLQNAISRRYERQCDRYALERTGFRDAYRSAFNKLARLNKDDPEPNRLEVLLLHSHPPIAERLAMAGE